MLILRQIIVVIKFRILGVWPWNFLILLQLYLDLGVPDHLLLELVLNWHDRLVIWWSSAGIIWLVHWLALFLFQIRSRYIGCRLLSISSTVHALVMLLVFHSCRRRLWVNQVWDRTSAPSRLGHLSFTWVNQSALRTTWGVFSQLNGFMLASWTHSCCVSYERAVVYQTLDWNYSLWLVHRDISQRNRVLMVTNCRHSILGLWTMGLCRSCRAAV